MQIENLIYHQGVAVGIEVAGRITFFSNATPDAIAALKG